MSRKLRSTLLLRTTRVRACDSESMPLDIDPNILSAVQSVYTTDLGLPEDWTAARCSEFIEAEAGKITWMVRAQASTLGDQRVEQWARRHGLRPKSIVENALRIAARTEALHIVLDTELYELIASDTDSL
jgi:hypothetical protein